MSKRYIFLSTCDTCRKIVKEVSLPDTFQLQDLKKEPIDKDTLSFLLKKYKLIDLVNKRSRKIKELGIKLDQLSDSELIDLLLQEYTFIKRPIVIDGETVFVGNGKHVREALNQHLNS